MSRTDSDSDWVAVAVLGKARGNRGELTAIPLSSKPERYQELKQVYLLGAAGESRPFDVESTWFHDGTLIFKFRGVETISEAETLVGCEVRVPVAERVPLDPGEYFESDLVGCEVIDRLSGRPLGTVSRWEDAGGCGLLVVGTLLIPFARSICVVIDPTARRIEVELPDGLQDLNRP